MSGGGIGEASAGTEAGGEEVGKGGFERGLTEGLCLRGGEQWGGGGRGIGGDGDVEGGMGGAGV